jgi:hypothetical protein
MVHMRRLAIALLLLAAGAVSSHAQNVWTFNGVWTDNDSGIAAIVCYTPNCDNSQIVGYPGPVAVLNGASLYWVPVTTGNAIIWPNNANWNHRCTLEPIVNGIIAAQWVCENANQAAAAVRGTATSKAEAYQFPDGKIPEPLSRLLEEIRRTPAPGPAR